MSIFRQLKLRGGVEWHAREPFGGIASAPKQHYFIAPLGMGMSELKMSHFMAMLRQQPDNFLFADNSLLERRSRPGPAGRPMAWPRRRSCRRQSSTRLLYRVPLRQVPSAHRDPV